MVGPSWGIITCQTCTVLCARNLVTLLCNEMWAWPTTQRTDTAQGRRLEHAHKRLLVVRIRMAHKLGPQRVAQPRTHALGEARRGRTHEGAPALLGAADPKHSRA